MLNRLLLVVQRGRQSIPAINSPDSHGAVCSKPNGAFRLHKKTP